MPDPFREGQAVVARERKRLPAGRCVEGDIGRDGEEQDDHGQGVDAPNRHGVAEDVQKGEAGGVVQGVFDRGEAEEVCDDEEEAEQAVQHEGPHHSFGHIHACVFHLFGHVGGCIGT